ncbi:MAG TPA: hypothetical protein VHV50_04430 [Actinomycetota bacterium]|nr:hypothetical protein [Actinomycetota bacterium]
MGRYFFSESPDPESTLAEHWNGTVWKIVATPNATDVVDGTRYNAGNRLNAVTAISANNVWAVGAHATFFDDSVPSKTLVEHWNGTAWKIVASPNVGSGANELNAIVAFSASNIWAVGTFAEGPSDGDHDRPLALHWNGTSWKSVTVPAFGTTSRLYGVAKVPDTSQLWAVGEYEKIDAVTGERTGGALIEKWNGSSWRVAATTTNWERLNSVTAISSTSSFAVGNSIMRWNGTSWTLMPNAVPSNGGYEVELEAVTRAPKGDLWAAGWRIVPGTLSYASLIERWDGATWSVVPSADRGRTLLQGIAKAQDTNRVWAVGFSSDLTPHRTLVETYC